MSFINQFNKIKYNAPGIKLSSGKRTDIFYDFFMWTPQEWEKAGEELANYINNYFEDFMYIVTPAVGGIIIGHEVAKRLRKRLYIFDKDKKFRPHAPPIPSRYLIVDDVTSSLSAAKEIICSIDGNTNKNNCVGIASLVHRGDNYTLGPVEVKYLHQGEIEE